MKTTSYLIGVSLDKLNRAIKRWRHEVPCSRENLYRFLYEHVHPLAIGAGISRTTTATGASSIQRYYDHFGDYAYRVILVARKLLQT